jgi:hypothetical protein
MPSALSIVKQFFPKVTKVNDADKPISIEVTKADNNSAQVRNHNACAMAVACKRKLKLDGVIVSIGTIYTIKGDTATRYRVPQSVSREIVSFDRDAGFSEGEYQIVPVPKNDRLGKGHSYPKTTGSKTGPGLKKRFAHFTTGIRSALGSKEDVKLRG